MDEGLLSGPVQLSLESMFPLQCVRVPNPQYHPSLKCYRIHVCILALSAIMSIHVCMHSLVYLLKTSVYFVGRHKDVALVTTIQPSTILI